MVAPDNDRDEDQVPLLGDEMEDELPVRPIVERPVGDVSADLQGLGGIHECEGVNVIVDRERELGDFVRAECVRLAAVDVDEVAVHECRLCHPERPVEHRDRRRHELIVGVQEQDVTVASQLQSEIADARQTEIGRQEHRAEPSLAHMGGDRPQQPLRSVPGRVVDNDHLGGVADLVERLDARERRGHRPRQEGLVVPIRDEDGHPGLFLRRGHLAE